MNGSYYACGLTVIQLTFQVDVPQEGPGGSAQSSWAQSMSLITQEPFYSSIKWGRQSDNLRRVYILTSWEQCLLFNHSTTTPLNEIIPTRLSSTLLPLLPHLSDTPRLVYLEVPCITSRIWALDTWVTFALDIIYIQVTRYSDLEAFVNNLQFGRWIIGSGHRTRGDIRTSLRGWSEHGDDAVTMTYAIIIYWTDRDAANRFKDLTRPCFAHQIRANRFEDHTTPCSAPRITTDDTWGREVLALFKELSSRGAAVDHVSVDFGLWPYVNIGHHKRYTEKRGLLSSSRCVVS